MKSHTYLAALGCLLALLSLSRPSQAQCQTAKILPSKPVSNGGFGSSVALDGDTAVIGGSFTRDPAVLDFDGTSWQEVQRLRLDGKWAAADSVDISGDWLAVGTALVEISHEWPVGAVRLYQQVGASWVEKQKLWPTGNGFFTFFGLDLDLDPGQLIVGACGDDLPIHNEGSAFVYDLVGSTWVSAGKLTPSDPTLEALFGRAVAIEGTTALIGAPAWFASSPTPGAAYVFERQNGSWVETQKLVPSSSIPKNGFGSAVALSGTTAMISGYEGPFGYPPSSVFVFEKGDLGWTQTQVLQGFVPNVYGNIGPSIALEGDFAVIGSWSDSDVDSDSGAAFHFKRIGGKWTQIGKLLPTNPTVGGLYLEGSRMGWDVALEGQTVFVGAPYDTEAVVLFENYGWGGLLPPGAAFVFRLGPDAVQYCSCRSGGNCQNADNHGGCANSTSKNYQAVDAARGQGAVLQGCGSGSVASDELVLETRWLPPFVPAFVTMGAASQSAPFGDGQLCVGPGTAGLYRFPLQSSGSEGVVTLGPEIVAYTLAHHPPAGQIAPGDTWYFQTVYRDPTGPCASTFNLSNGLRVTFQP